MSQTQNLSTRNALARLTMGLSMLAYGTSTLSRNPKSNKGRLMVALGAMKAAEGTVKFCPMKAMMQQTSMMGQTGVPEVGQLMKDFASKGMDMATGSGTCSGGMAGMAAGAGMGSGNTGGTSTTGAGLGSAIKSGLAGMASGNTGGTSASGAGTGSGSSSTAGTSAAGAGMGSSNTTSATNGGGSGSSSTVGTTASGAGMS
ncbi:MAG: YgaP-like transmembrane domain, partial [Paenisporosarcina sp.]